MTIDLTRNEITWLESHLQLCLADSENFQKGRRTYLSICQTDYSIGMLKKILEKVNVSVVEGGK